MKFVAIFFTIAGFLIVENSALLCYSCLNHTLEMCNAKTTPPLLVTVNCKTTPENEYKNGSRATCYKIEKAVQIDQHNITYRYKRGCTIAGGQRDFCDEEAQLDPEIKCYLCKSNWCNNGNDLKILKILLAAVIIFNIFFSLNYVRIYNVW